ncbi:MAG: hypothetical protein LBH15_00930 [Treponema sp.]|jgi:hypothetical protein|nr:hypothetical protein [Treponema sp.]
MDNFDAPLGRMKSYVEQFNREDNELYLNHIPNSAAGDWMARHVPLVDLPDRELEQVYYFRWWTYRKHIKKTPAGFIISEFLPEVPWAGKYNSISCAAGHHLAEGRWLRDEAALDAYINYWYRESDNIDSYTHWIDSALWDLCELRGDYSLGVNNLDPMAQRFREREDRYFHRGTGLFWGSSDRDGQEFAVSGNGFRLPQNCYMAAKARAIANFARIAGRADLEEEFSAKGRALAGAIEKLLWSEGDRFYLNIHYPRETGPDGVPLKLSAAPPPDPARGDRRFKCRELWGYSPWYFGLAPPGREGAFDLLADPGCFYGLYGLSTADRGHPGYGCFYTGEELNAWRRGRDQGPVGPQGHECLWNGPSWPFATSFALAALAASERPDDGLFYKLLKQYAGSHRLSPGKADPPFWIDEVQHPDTGDWISRTRLMRWDESGWSKEKGGVERGKDYNHSTFCNLVIAGLFGLGVSAGALSARPRIPPDWDYAALHHIPFRGKLYTLRYRGGVELIRED